MALKELQTQISLLVSQINNHQKTFMNCTNCYPRK